MNLTFSEIDILDHVLDGTFGEDQLRVIADNVIKNPNQYPILSHSNEFLGCLIEQLEIFN